MDTAMPSTNAVLAAHVAGQPFVGLSGEVRHAFKRTLLDFVTCATVGNPLPVTRAVLDYLREIDGSTACTVIGSDARLSPSNAALVNGTATHGLDFDDGLTRASAHPAGAIFPAVLAVAEHHKVPARTIILATVLGYDVMLRVASAMHPKSARQGWHNTAVGGVFGAAAAVSKLLGLDAEKTAHAMGLAASFAGGIRQYLHDGAEVKRLHPGKAARDGILCAELAARGITGPDDAFDGADGVFRAFVNGDVDREALLSDLGFRFEIASAYFKPYPCCRHFHAALDGAIALKAEHGFGSADIAHVHVGLYGVGAHGHDHKRATNLLEAQMSAPCAAALALAHGEVAVRHFEQDNLDRPEIAELIGKVDVAVDPECENLYPRQRSGFIRVALKDGRTVEKRVKDPRGEGGNPLSDADLEQKLRVNCEPILGADRCEALIKAVWNFEEMADPADFFRLLAAAPHGAGN